MSVAVAESTTAVTPSQKKGAHLENVEVHVQFEDAKGEDESEADDDASVDPNNTDPDPAAIFTPNEKGRTAANTEAKAPAKAKSQQAPIRKGS